MTVEEIIARGVRESDGCGLSVNGLTVFCDDHGVDAELRDSVCGCREAARTIVSALDSAGFAVVPKEPTDAMIEAGKEWFLEAGFVAIDRDPLNVWRAMCHEARPK